MFNIHVCSTHVFSQFGNYLKILISIFFVFGPQVWGAEYETIVRDHRSNLLQKSSSEIVISKNTIEKLKPASVVDLLEKAGGMSGLSAQGATKSVFLRGAGADQVLFILDGVVLNDPTSPAGAFDLTFLDVRVVEEVRIWTPTESVLWGSGGLGGIISIRTRTQGGVVKLQGGSDQSLSGTGSFFIEPDKVIAWTRGFLISTHQRAGQSVASINRGGQEKDQYHMTTVLAQAQKLSPSGTTQIMALANQGFEDLDGIGGTGPLDDPNARRNQRQNILSLRHDLNPAEGWELRQDISLKSLERNHFDAANSMSGSSVMGLYISNGSAYRLQNLVGQKWGYWDFGLDLSQNQSHIEEDSSGARTLIGQTENRGGVYLRAVWSLDRWRFLPGYRFENQGTTDHLRSFRAEYQYDFYRVFDFEVTEGVKRPTLYQKFYPSGGNPLLESEKVQHWNLGHTYRYALDQTEGFFRFFIFSNRWKNLITYDLSISKYLNIAQAQSEGYEVSTQLVKENRFFGARLTEMWTKDNQGQSLLRRPRYMASLDYGKKYEKAQATLTGLWKSGREDSVGGSRYPLASQWRWDLMTAYQIKNQFDLHFDIQNIFDSREEEIYGYSVPERTFILGISISI